MKIQVIFKWYSLMQAKIKEMKQANPNKIVHLIISGIHFIWVKNSFHIGIHCLHQAYKLDFILLFGDQNWNLMTILYSKIAKVKLIDICIHTFQRT